MICSCSIAQASRRKRARPELLAAVVRNKSLMLADKAASYDTAVLGVLRLFPTGMTEALARDYGAMVDMFMTAPPGLHDMLAGISDLETRLNAIQEMSTAT